MAQSSIEWTALNGRRGFVWNLWWGCSEVAPECGKGFSGAGAACYAAVFASRGMHAHFRGVAEHGQWTGEVLPARENVWEQPIAWNRNSACAGAGVFTSSMTDFWYEGVPIELQERALDVMDRATRLFFLILTKRPAMARRRLAELRRRLPANAWLGVTIGHRQSLPLLKVLRQIEAPTKFISAEPLLNSLLPLDLTNIDWCITGGQSGAGALICNPDHVRELRDLCLATDTGFFHKQWGSLVSNPTPSDQELADLEVTKGGATLDGRLWRQFPHRPETMV